MASMLALQYTISRCACFPCNLASQCLRSLQGCFIFTVFISFTSHFCMFLSDCFFSLYKQYFQAIFCFLCLFIVYIWSYFMIIQAYFTSVFEQHCFPFVQICKYHLNRCCLKGDECPFSHDLSAFPCKFYHTRGYCLEGEMCRFSHKVCFRSCKIQIFFYGWLGTEYILFGSLFLWLSVFQKKQWLEDTYLEVL